MAFEKIYNTRARNRKKSHHAFIASNLMLYFGLIILIAAFIFMIIHFSEADSIFTLWLPFVVAGIFLVFLSQLIKGRQPGTFK